MLDQLRLEPLLDAGGMVRVGEGDRRQAAAVHFVGGEGQAARPSALRSLVPGLLQPGHRHRVQRVPACADRVVPRPVRNVGASHAVEPEDLSLVDGQGVWEQPLAAVGAQPVPGEEAGLEPERPARGGRATHAGGVQRAQRDDDLRRDDAPLFQDGAVEVEREQADHHHARSTKTVGSSG